MEEELKKLAKSVVDMEIMMEKLNINILRAEERIKSIEKEVLNKEGDK